MPKKEEDRFRRVRGEKPGKASQRFDEDEPTFEHSEKKMRADDDFSNIPAVKSKIQELDGQAYFFIGKGDRVTIKLDKEYPEVVMAAEDIFFESKERVLVLSAEEGFVGITLAAIHRDCQFFLYDANLSKMATAQKNVEANVHIAPNVRVVDEAELEEVLKKEVSSVVFKPPGFTAVEFLQERIFFADQILPIGGKLFVISNKKSGAERHEEMMRSAMGSEVGVIGRGKGGFRVIVGKKVGESNREKMDLKEKVTFSVLDKNFTVHTEPSLFSREDLDIGTRFLLEQVDLTRFERLLDIGCGWGAIGIVAAAVNKTGEVVMIDIDTHAIKVAKKNVEELDLSDRIEVIATDNIRTIGGNFDLMLSNPPFHADTRTLLGLFSAAKEKLAKKGQLYVVVEQTYVKKLTGILEEVFGKVGIVKEDETIHFSILVVRK